MITRSSEVVTPINYKHLRNFFLLFCLCIDISLAGCSFLAGSPFSPKHVKTTARRVDKQSSLESHTGVPSTKTRLLPAVDWLSTTHLAPRLSDEIRSCRKVLALPPEQIALADSTNYGKRARLDSVGRKIPYLPQLIILHETVISVSETINFFRTPHPLDDDQASYHLLIDSDGRLIRIVPDLSRAYGAGMSSFGDFRVRTRVKSVGSVNNIALHISLETPLSGRGPTVDSASSHAGYSQSQYRTVAAQVLLWQALYGIPMSRVTTHAAVDRSHSRYDPRSFRWDAFDREHQAAANACDFGEFAQPA
jgi:hypothetical protein